MASGKSAFGHERKFMNHLMLIDYMMKDHITPKIMHCQNLEELYNTLLAYPTIGTFWHINMQLILIIQNW